MSQPTDLRVFALASIAHRCGRETELFFQRQPHDPRYCFELFRRALVDRHEGAWALVYAQYQPLVARWVVRHSAFASSGEEVQYYVNRAFEKMWAALNPDKFSRFPDLKSLLRYLQMCVHSAVLDQVRQAQQSVIASSDEDLVWGSRSQGPTTDGQVLAEVYRQQFWDLIGARLHNEQERKVVYGSFVLGLKPREICVQFQGTFRDVREVYRVKENVLARLRRDAELGEILVHDA